jgi:hypothetical protein
MKIIDRQTFLAMPPNTIFAKYKPCCFDDIQIKGDTWNNDFWFQDFLSIEDEGEDDFFNILENARETGSSFKLDLQSESRDGLFDNKQLFAVFEKNDVESLINRLKECL